MKKDQSDSMTTAKQILESVPENSMTTMSGKDAVDFLRSVTPREKVSDDPIRDFHIKFFGNTNRITRPTK